MLAMYSLLLGYLKKSFHTIFFAFVFPIIMLSILVAATGASGSNSAANSALPGLAMASSSVIGIVTLAMTYCDFKQSIIIKRIGATPIRSWQFVLSIITFHVALIFISNFWVIGIGIAFYHKSLVLSNVNWGYVILAIALSSVMCCSIGVILGVLAPDFKVANAFALLLYLPSSFLSGQYIPYGAIKSSQTLVVMSKIIPFSYPVTIMNRGWNYYATMPPDAFLFNNYWLPITVSLAWMIGLAAAAVLVYKYHRK